MLDHQTLLLVLLIHLLDPADALVLQIQLSRQSSHFLIVRILDQSYLLILLQILLTHLVNLFFCELKLPLTFFQAFQLDL